MNIPPCPEMDPYVTKYAINDINGLPLHKTVIESVSRAYSDWWRDRCLELLEYAEHQMASPEMIHCSKLYSECGCGLDALSKAILEANK